jgi:magnesium chelatase accessory protein
MNRALDWGRDGADWPLRDASRFVTAGGIRWHVQRTGSGPAMLLIHGTGASTHSFRHLAPILGERFSLVVPDLPGHAFSAALPGEEMTLPGMAQALAALLAALEFRPEWIIGHSAGAAIALRMALDRRVTPHGGIIGLNAALRPFGGAMRRVFPSLARALVLNPLVPSLFAWQARDPEAIRRVIASTGSHLDAEGLRLYQRLFQKRDHIESTLAMMARWNLEGLDSELERSDLCLHLVAALGDTAVSPEDARRIRQRRKSTRLHFLPGLGHLCHEEAPETVAELIGRIAGERLQNAA